MRSVSPSAIHFGVVLALAFGVSCQPRHVSFSPKSEPRATCEERRTQMIGYLAALSDEPAVSTTRVEPTASTLGRVPGAGPVLELSPNVVVVDGQVVDGRDLEEQALRFSAWSTSTFGDGQSSNAVQKGSARQSVRVLYVAASPELDVKTVRAFLGRVPDFVELRLLVRAPADGGSKRRDPATDEGRRLSSRILLEADPAERKRLADEGYAAFANCPALTTAATSIAETDPRRRWPLLRESFERILPACSCETLDTSNLRLLLSAEQRAGTASLGWVPLSFLRDERCSATMPLRAIQKLVRQIEAFDEEFSAGVDRDALRFGDVLEDDRLRVYFCDPLPGETLAAKARAHSTLYFRAPGGDVCEGWTFEPLALGTPMGTWRRASVRTPLAFHYWQATEEIRVFGPIDPASPSKPTDSRSWACDETLHLTGVDASSIQIDGGRWFYSEAACQRTRDEMRGSGCFGMRAAEGPR